MLAARALGSRAEAQVITTDALQGRVQLPFKNNSSTLNITNTANVAFRHPRFSTQPSALGTPPPPPPLPLTPTLEIRTMPDFQSIIAVSNRTPVVLDAYATWCGPCKQLDPVLKKLVADHGGKVVLAKMDIELPELAPMVQQLVITSVPTLFMIMGGRIVDAKNGVPPQSELKEWISKAAQVAGEAAAAQGGPAPPGAPADPSIDPKLLLKEGFTALEAPGAAAIDIAPIFAAVLNTPAAEPVHKAAATAGLARCAALDGDIPTAKELLQSARTAAGEGASVPDEVTAAEAAVSIAEAMEGAKSDARSIPELQAAVEADPKDLDALHTLSLRLFQEKKAQEAVDAALLIVRRDREWREQAGKTLLLQLCDALGTGSDVAKAARRRLSNIWFI